MQPDGWSAQPIVMACRFAPDADLDPATGTPVGTEGYYLLYPDEAVNWTSAMRRRLSPQFGSVDVAWLDHLGKSPEIVLGIRSRRPTSGGRNRVT